MNQTIRPFLPVRISSGRGMVFCYQQIFIQLNVRSSLPRAACTEGAASLLKMFAACALLSVRFHSA